MEVRPGSHVFELLEIGFTLENLDMKLTNSLAGEREETKKRHFFNSLYLKQSGLQLKKCRLCEKNSCGLTEKHHLNPNQNF